MNDVKMNVRIRDLRQMGLEGGAIAFLENNRRIELKKDFATEHIKGYVHGEIRELELKLEYKKIYSQITLISRHNVLVAKREKNRCLLLTGRGFRRKNE